MPAEKRCDVVVVGSCNYDLTSFVEDFPDVGQTVLSKRFAAYPGGKGLNQAVKCAEMFGTADSVYMVGKIGNDDFGKKLLNFMKSKKVATDFVLQDQQAQTGNAIIVVKQSDGENMIVVNAGANANIGIQNVLECKEAISRAKVVVCQLEIPLPSVLEAFKMAKTKTEVITILNPAPMAKNLVSSGILDYVDVLCLNEVEATDLTGIVMDFGENADDFSQNFQRQAQGTVDALFNLSHNIKVVVVTIGARGAYHADTTNRTVTFQRAEKISGQDTTGAGDAFVGALAYYFATSPQAPNDEKVQRSCLVANNQIRHGRHVF